MEKQQLAHLIEKFRKGNISESEREQLDSWYDSFSNASGYSQTLSQEERTKMEVSLLKKINEKIDVPLQENPKKLLPFVFGYNPVALPYYRVAAAFALIVFLTAFVYLLLYPTNITHTTGFGQTARIVLPDNSIAILNGNSTLTYKSGWGSDGVREVALEGEAYFAIKPSNTQQRFLVHMSDGVHVEVLGTEFTVSNRQTKARVVLNSGRIQLNTEHQGKEKLLMSPGELIEFDPRSDNYTRRYVNPEVYSSWKDKKLVLDRTSLQELLTMIEDTYGLRLQVSDNGLLDLEMSGKVPAENLDTLIQDISAIYKVNFKNY